MVTEILRSGMKEGAVMEIVTPAVERPAPLEADRDSKYLQGDTDEARSVRVVSEALKSTSPLMLSVVARRSEKEDNPPWFGGASNDNGGGNEMCIAMCCGVGVVCPGDDGWDPEWKGGDNNGCYENGCKSCCDMGDAPKVPDYYNYNEPNKLLQKGLDLERM